MEKEFSVEEAASLFGIEKESLLKALSDSFGKIPEQLSRENLEKVILENRLKISLEGNKERFYLEFLKKIEKENEVIYLALVEKQSLPDSPMMIEIRSQQEVSGFYEILGIIKNLLLEKELEDSRRIVITEEKIEVQDFYPEFGV